MKSPQILRLQQQFLASLHSNHQPWLLKEIIPAPGFSNASEVLDIYLNRAMARTIDPLQAIFRSVHWLTGTTVYHQILEDFYRQSLGEPLNSEALASEFANFIGQYTEKQWEEISLTVNIDPESLITQKQALFGASMMDWRCHWVSILPNRIEHDAKTLHARLHDKEFIWLRPMINPCARLCISAIDLEDLYIQVKRDAPDSKNLVKSCSNGPSHFLIHADLNHQVIVRKLSDQEGRLLNHCNGTHTVTSLIHEASFYQKSAHGTLKLMHQLIDEGVITQFKNPME